MGRQGWRFGRPRWGGWALVPAVLMLGFPGCGAVKRDVYQYYRQMARNYQEAEQKARFDAIALEARSRGHLQAGEFHRYKRTRQELERIKDWQARCAAQQKRFEKAAKKLEAGLAPQDTTAPPAAAQRL